MTPSAITELKLYVTRITQKLKGLVKSRTKQARPRQITSAAIRKGPQLSELIFLLPPLRFPLFLKILANTERLCSFVVDLHHPRSE
jgi:hypothetical protein